MKDLKDQVGCGYCLNELNCVYRDPFVNKAKNGCTNWLHYLAPEVIKPLYADHCSENLNKNTNYEDKI